MACNYPMYRAEFTPLIRQIVSRADLREHNGGIIISRDEYLYLIDKHPFAGELIKEIPCGKCLGCRLEYSRQWANRCVHEASCHLSNVMVTLTYSDEYLKYHDYLDIETGEISSRPMLQPNDMTKFMKDLRRYFDYHYGHDNIRFFGCGEYGEQYQRPHFHLILFNCDFEDKKLLYAKQADDLYIPTYTSEILSGIWKKGICAVSDVNWNSCAYVSRYIMKKQKGEGVKNQRASQRLVLGNMLVPPERLDEFINDSARQDCDWQHEFVRSSRRPGIAREYYENHKDEIYKTDEMFVPMKDGIRACKPAKYYDSLYDLENPERMEELKAQRIACGKASAERKALFTTLTDEEQRINREERLARASKKLVRDGDFVTK